MVRILDCTLRDGGYYTNWDFSRSLVQDYFAAFNNLPVDYLEIGYRNNPAKEYEGEFFYCPLYVLERAKAMSQKKLVVIVDEKNVRVQDVEPLLEPCRGLIDMIRIAVDPQNFIRAIRLAERIKGLGFEVAFNTMYMSKWKEYPAFLAELGNINGIADYFYMVDSFGGVFPGDVRETISLVKDKTSCPIGFHGHNNLELALINSLTAIENGASIIDSTVTGMGRGAGNLKTELLLSVLNASENVDVDFNALSSVVDGFTKLQEQHGWGTNLPYMVSGANSLPQKDVMEWVSRRFYSFNSIIRALQNQKQGVKDNEQFPKFVPKRSYNSALIIGGGPNAAHHADAIIEFLKRQKDICIIHASSKNAKHYTPLAIDQFFCLVGNEGHRLERVFGPDGSFGGQCLLPPFPRRMGTYVPTSVRESAFELEKISFIGQLQDTHTALALQTALELGANEILITGYDGYQESTITQQERSLVEENELLFSMFKKNFAGSVNSLTPTNYQNLDVKSVYSFLI